MSISRFGLSALKVSMNNLQLSSELSLSPEIVDAFAAFTGDHSALHMRGDFARRTRFRQRVAHGMLSVIALTQLQNSSTDGAVSFRALSGRFLRPAGLDDKLRLLIDVDPAAEGGVEFSARWERVTDKA
ncbi:MaoC/PaaZ C-terminal domain-containing protein, partial [Limnospira sp. PMC 1243.20]|uniref:MaoC family dehydratase n=1 Tax=Limnospira sp. PMC 1243.20 TaxID=2981041 RepID=UPI0028E156FB